MKKLLMTAMIVLLLLMPLGNTALAGHEEAAAPLPVQDFLPGDAPAETDGAEAMLPAVHGLVLAALNHDADRFDPGDGELAWEGLYNMLSLYGQLDSRCESNQDELALPEETVWDYAAALNLTEKDLGPLPAGIRDRMNYDNVSHQYILVCGEAGLAQLQMEELQPTGGGLLLTGALIDAADGTTETRFQAVLQPRDNLFGFAISSLTLA